MGNKLEQLLNSLVSKGWKPFGRKKTLHITIYDCDLNVYFDGGFMNEDKKSFRELVSKESNLWQFVCENELYPPYIKHRWFRDLPTNGLQIHDYRYWIIESSLKDESELEDFLISNIKVDVESK